MKILINYFERLAFHIAYITEILSFDKITSILLLLISIINLIAIAMLIVMLLYECQPKKATVPFWISFCLFFWGIGGILFFLCEMLSKMKRLKGNIYFVYDIFRPLLCAIVCFVLFSGADTEGASSLAYGIAGGTITIYVQIVVNFVLKRNKSIYIKDDFNEMEKEVIANKVGNKAARMELLRKHLVYTFEDYFYNENGVLKKKEISMVKIDSKEIDNSFLIKEIDKGIIVEKKYRRCNGSEFDVLEIAPITEKCLYANLTSMMLLLMFFSPYLLWVMNILEKYL